MTKLNENIVGIDAAIFMHPTVWKASGHVDAFNDPLIDNKDSKKRYRADVLLEDHMAKYAGQDREGGGEGEEEVRRGLQRGAVPRHQPQRVARTGADQRRGRPDEDRARSERPGSGAPADHRRGDQVPRQRHRRTGPKCASST